MGVGDQGGEDVGKEGTWQAQRRDDACARPRESKIVVNARDMAHPTEEYVMDTIMTIENGGRTVRLRIVGRGGRRATKRTR